MIAPVPWGRSFLKNPKQLKQFAQFQPYPSRLASFILPLQKDLSGIGKNLQLAMAYLLSARNLVIALPRGVFQSLSMRSSLSTALYSIYLEHTSHWPIPTYTDYYNLGHGHEITVKERPKVRVQMNLLLGQKGKNDGWLFVCFLVYLNMFLTNDQERLRRNIFKSAIKTARDLQAEAHLMEHFQKRKKRIEILQKQSIANQLYIFTRTTLKDSESQSSEQWELEVQGTVQYDLHSQNKKNKNYQTQTNSIAVMHMHARCLSTGEIPQRGGINSGRQGLVRSQSRWREESSGRRKGKEERDKGSGKKKEREREEINLSNYNSRKGDKTALNSSKKLIVAEQYSLASQHAKTKKVSQAYTVTCRRKNPPRSRVATEHS